MRFVFLCLVVGLLTMGGANAAKPLDYRVWQLQDNNLPHMKRLIDRAAAEGVNRIQLSHDIIMYAEEILNDPARLAYVNEAARYAKSKGLGVDIWTHELEGITKEMMPDGKVNLDDPALWKFVSEKYERIFDQLCPDVDGLVLTFHETQIKVWDKGRTSSVMSDAERIQKLIEVFDSVCKPRGKKLFIRTFTYEPGELARVTEALSKTQADVITMTKCVPHDWQPYYPNNPAIGNVGGKPQIVEFDLGYEFLGLSRIPYMDLAQLTDRLQYGISKGISGAVLRVERLEWRAIDTPNQANIDVFTDILNNPDLDWKPLYKEWLTRRYGKEAANPLFDAFSRTFETVNKGYFVLGFWVTNHSLMPDYGYATGSLRRRTTAKWDPAYKETEAKLFSPTLATIREINAEKAEALKLAKASLADIERARPYLKPADYTYLKGYFERLEAMVEVWTPAMEVVFGIDAYKLSKTDAARKFLLAAADRLEAAANANKTHLMQMAVHYKNPTPEGNYNTSMGLVELARKTAASE